MRSAPEYIDIVYICLHVNYLNKILFNPNPVSSQKLIGVQKLKPAYCLLMFKHFL